MNDEKEASLIWGTWLALVAAGFAGLETWAYREHREGLTLSGTLRRWLGIHPRRKGRRLLGILFTLLLAWFAGHILDGDD